MVRYLFYTRTIGDLTYQSPLVAFSPSYCHPASQHDVTFLNWFRWRYVRIPVVTAITFTQAPYHFPQAIQACASTSRHDSTVPYQFIIHHTPIPRQWPGYRSPYGDSLRAGRSGDQIPVGARISAPMNTGHGAHPPFSTIGTASRILIFFRNHPVYVVKTQIIKEIFESQANRRLYSLTQTVHKARHRVIIRAS